MIYKHGDKVKLFTLEELKEKYPQIKIGKTIENLPHKANVTQEEQVFLGKYVTLQENKGLYWTIKEKSAHSDGSIILINEYVIKNKKQKMELKI